MRQSPFHDRHLVLGARMVPFAGWEMPVQYQGIRPEHEAVRTSVGVFDISHMGELEVRGPQAAGWLDRQLTNHVAPLEVGAAQYTLLLNDRGGVIDDLIVYRLAADHFLMIVNAARVDEDFDTLQAALEPGIELLDLSDRFAALAVQGPRSRAVFGAVCGDGATMPERNRIAAVAGPEGPGSYACGTGYTGEDGFELLIPVDQAGAWFDRIVAAVNGEGGQVCGLGARDTLRLEVAYPLNGQDLLRDRSPLQAGLRFFVKLDKGDFRGRAALERELEQGLPARLAGLRMIGRTPPPRHGYPVRHGDREVAELTSGALSPTLGTGIGLAYLPPELAAIGTRLEIDIRGRHYPCEVVRKPFYSKSSPNA